ncbi:hypothetical protein [Streptomyces sp. NPDC050560]|uniref:hypothetical protein n=1 Tax=Streptomyces sp. NPDC050560 TaxID=3365630 RepID=UPI0037997780
MKSLVKRAPRRRKGFAALPWAASAAALASPVKALREAAAEFTEETGTRVDVQAVTPDNVFLTKVQAAARTNDLPDVLEVHSAGDDLSFGGAGLLQELSGLARPALITIALLTAIPAWNEYQLTRISLNDPHTYTLPIALQNMQSENVVQYNSLMAAALIMVVPVVVLFLCTQRYFVNGLMGAVKG